ncbi:MAG: transcription antitermination factor NusB [Methyloligellaceae bacterium]
MSSEAKQDVISRAAPRSAARLAAVQALYQMDVAQTDIKNVIAEFSLNRLSDDLGDDQLQRPDAVFFQNLLTGVVREQRDIDPLINEQLASGWRLSRIDSTLRAILRSAVYELIYREDVPARVVINEYMDIAHAFFEKSETRVVNGVLDHIAKNKRAEEMSRPREA